MKIKFVPWDRLSSLSFRVPQTTAVRPLATSRQWKKDNRLESCVERQFAAIRQAAVHPHLTAPQAQAVSRIVALAGARG